MQYYSTIKNELSSHEYIGKCKYTLLSERNQPEKATYCIIQLYDIWKSQNYNNSKNQLLGGAEGIDRKTETGRT